MWYFFEATKYRKQSRSPPNQLNYALGTQWNMINNALEKRNKNIYNTMLSKKKAREKQTNKTQETGDADSSYGKSFILRNHQIRRPQIWAANLLSTLSFMTTYYFYENKD